MTGQKPKVAFYWCASCGGCEEAIIDLNEGLLDVTAAVEIVFWPAALDFKYQDVEVLADGELAVAFINGAVRTDEQAHIARLLRRKARVVAAFGSCAHTGGIPGLANLTTRDEIFRTSYLSSPTVDNPAGTVPLTRTIVDGVEATLPGFWKTVHTLDQVIEVDCYVPGCPPMPNTIVDAIDAIFKNRILAKGAVLGSSKALCDTCRRTRSTTPILHRRFFQPHQIVAQPDVCFLDQGIVCCGPATRSGCGEKCLEGNMPCTGCYGPLDSVTDMGARMVSAIAACMEGDTEEAMREAAATVLDPAGTFYRYGVPASLLFGAIEREDKK